MLERSRTIYIVKLGTLTRFSQMRKSPYQLRKERQQVRVEREREKDTIYYLDFIPKDGQPTGRSPLLNDPWCVRLPRNHNNDPKLIDDAIRAFEESHKVESWREIAVSCKVESLWYP